MHENNYEGSRLRLYLSWGFVSQILAQMRDMLIKQQLDVCEGVGNGGFSREFSMLLEAENDYVEISSEFPACGYHGLGKHLLIAQVSKP